MIGNHPRQDILNPPMAVTILLQGIRFSLVTPRVCSNFNPARHQLAPLSGNIGRVTGDLCLCRSWSEISAGISVMLSLFMIVYVSDVLSYLGWATRAFIEPWLWVVWRHTLAKWFYLSQFKHCFPHTGQTVGHWELVWFVVPQPEQGLEAFDLDFLYAEIQVAELVCWYRWACSWSADSNASAGLIISSRGLRYSALVRMSVCKVLLCNPHMNWSFIWMDCKSAWHEGHEYSQSWATDFSHTIRFWMDSPSDWDRVAKLRRYTAGLECLVKMVSWFESYLVHWEWRSMHGYWGYCVELNPHRGCITKQQFVMAGWWWAV